MPRAAEHCQANQMALHFEGFLDHCYMVAKLVNIATQCWIALSGARRNSDFWRPGHNTALIGLVGEFKGNVSDCKMIAHKDEEDEEDYDEDDEDHGDVEASRYHSLKVSLPDNFQTT
eukprot:s11_g35.t1